MRSIAIAILLLALVGPDGRAQETPPPTPTPTTTTTTTTPPAKTTPPDPVCGETPTCKVSDLAGCRFAGPVPPSFGDIAEREERESKALKEAKPASQNLPTPREKDVAVYACGSWKTNVSCLDAIQKPPDRLGDTDIAIIRDFYIKRNVSARCYQTNPLLAGAFRTSVYRTESYASFMGLERGLQIAPTVTLGIPFGISGDGNAAKALHNGGTVTGINLRFTLHSYIVSAAAFLGRMDADKAALDPVKFPNPQFVVMGLGVDVAGGIFGVSWVNARLRGDGLFGENRDHTTFWQVTIDLAAVTTMAAGAVNSDRAE